MKGTGDKKKGEAKKRERWREFDVMISCPSCVVALLLLALPLPLPMFTNYLMLTPHTSILQ